MNELNNTSIRATNEVRVPEIKQNPPKNTKNQTINDIGKNSLKSFTDSLNENSSLEDWNIDEGPPDKDEDFSFLQSMLLDDPSEDEIVANNNEPEAMNDDAQDALSSSQNNENVKSPISLGNPNPGLDDLNSINNRLESLNSRSQGFKDDVAILDSCLQNWSMAFENATIMVKRDDGAFDIKFLKDATFQEKQNAKDEDVGLVIGNRYFVNPRAEIPEGSVLTFHINGQPMQLVVAYMTQEQANKLGTMYKGYVSQLVANAPAKEKESDQKHVERNAIAENLRPPFLRHVREREPEKKTVGRSSAPGVSQIEMDKNAEAAAVLQKARNEKDNMAADRKRQAESKEVKKETVKQDESHKVIAEGDDTMTVMQAPIKNPDNLRKPDVGRENRSKVATRKFQAN